MDSVFKCTVCKNYFTRKDNFMRHMKIVHKNKDIEMYDNESSEDESEM